MWLPKVLSGKKVYARFDFDHWSLIGGQVFELVRST